MRNTSKITTLENRFPLLAVEHGCIISKDADITVAFEVELPELYTVTSAEYEAIHGCWCKAIKVLPDFSVVHKQDWFIKEKYRPELQKDDMSFLSRSFERHFNERPYLKHTCYLYLTKTTRERNRMQSNFSTLCRGHIIPKELDRENAGKFMEATEQFERIMNDSGFVRLRRLSTDEIVGTDGKAGLLERYFSLLPEDNATLQDIELSAREMRIGDNRLCLHTLSDAEDLPGTVATDTRYERLSTDRSDCRLSFASPVGLLLPCNHIYNQYVIIDNSEENLQRFEKSARNMQSLSRYSRSNSINREWIDQYLNEAHSYGLTSVRAHFNVMAWSDDAEELKHIRNDVGSQLASMECVPRHNTIDCPTLYWAAMPGNAADFPAEESFHTFIEQAVCLFTEETNQLPQLALALRHQDGGQAHGKTAAPRYFRPADEKRHHDQQKQIRAGSQRKRQVLLHEPPREAVLGAGHARGTGGHGKFLSGTVRDDTAQDGRRGRRVFHLHGGEAHQLQSVLH